MTGLAAACGGGDGGGDSPDAPVGNGPSGRVQVFAEDFTAQAYAVFRDGPPFGDVIASAGECTGYLAVSESQSAGTITLADGIGELGTMPPAVPDVYRAFPIPPTPGQTLTVTASGDVVPAFTGTVLVPQALASPTVPGEFSRTTGGTISWTAGDGQVMWVILDYTNGTTRETVRCRTADDGSFTVTAAELALIPSAVNELDIVVLARVNETNVAAGDWNVLLATGSASASPLEVALTP